jgi:hypothetical protein
MPQFQSMAKGASDQDNTGGFSDNAKKRLQETPADS